MNTFKQELEKIIDDHELRTGIDFGDEIDRESLKQAIIELVDREKEKSLTKCLELMKDVMAENFHYRVMCGEYRDPEGKIDVNKALIEYQELEPERKKFSDYVEEQKAKLGLDK